MYEIYCKLRDSKGVKDSDVVRATGITKSTFSDWKSGRSNPKNDKLQKIADYFGVSVDYLMTGEDKSVLSDSKYYINEETAQMADKIFHNKELRLLFDAARDAQPEDLETVHHMLLALKRKERGDID
ncbi:MAG: helix-turn-helix transcriptional regulator [Lachnospiraceae bacterium]|nr:helix-turn-helix transcriptional regulator [Lachnospiraceae bacterium]